MKKSLSLLLSIALIFGAFASAASAAESDLTTQQKYDALAAKGIFAGINGEAALDQKMTRAQFARVLALILGLEGIGNPDTKVVSEKPFSDVKVDAWYAEEVAAVKEAGAMVGNADGTFNPQGNVTVQELAVAIAQTLKLEAVKDAKVEGAADWAAGYIQALLDKGISVPTNYTEPATRAQLVDATYAADQILNPVEPEKVSVVSAKPTDVNKVEVTLDKAVDTSKATLTLKRGTATVTTTTEWSADKKSATLTLSSTKISEADYSVTLGGIDSAEIGTAVASFKGENEKVTKLEFVTTSDEIAYTTAARVKLRAENQYGKLASFNSASYTVNADASMSPSLSKDSEGYLIVKLNTKTLTNATPGLSMIPIYVYANDNHVTAYKAFKLGFEPFITKSELGEVKYDNGKTALINAGDTATFDVKLYDQYGNPVVVSQGLTPVFNNNIVPFAQDVTVTVNDYDNDDEYEARVSLDKKTDKAQSHTLTLFVGSSSAQGTFEIGTSKVATTVEFESFDGTLATGDEGKYVTIAAYDANGDKLTAQEIADNAKLNRFTVTASGVTGNTASIVTVGPNKGKIALPKVTAPAKSYVFLTVSILSPNANSLKTLQIPVADARVPASLVVDKKPHDKAVLGAESEFKILVKDQYGETIKGDWSDKYRVVYEFVPGTTGTVITGPNATEAMAAAPANVSSDFDKVNEAHKFDTAPGLYGRASLKATLQQNKGSVGSPDWKEISNPVTVAIESIDPSKVQLNYSIADITSLYASIDNDSLFPATPTTASKTAKEISLLVKDNAGNTVAYPDNILDISTSSNLIAQVADNGAGKAFVIGNKAGEATVNAVVYKANGETVTLTAKVTVKNDPVAAVSMSSKGDVELAPGAVNGANAGALMEAKLKDNYDIEYKAVDGDFVTYEKLLGVRYTVSDFSGAKVSIDSKTGVLSGFALDPGATKYQFVVTATAPNGQSTSTVFYSN